MFFNSSDCQRAGNKYSPPLFQIIFFFVSLYLVAFAQGGHRPCVQAFEADQFDEEDEKECKWKSSFFNWWYFCSCVSVTVGILGLNYIEDTLSWGLSFGISSFVMFFALVLFLLGIRTYRFSIQVEDDLNPFVRVGRALLNVVARSARSVGVENQKVLSSKEAEFMEAGADIEEAKAILSLAPIWFACLGYGIVLSQNSTLYTKQGASMDRHITSTFQIPAASLVSLISLTIVVFVPIYDQVLIPLARVMTNKPSGISMLQRIGTGVFLSFLSMVVAAIVEQKRHSSAAQHVQISVWWLSPQYIIFGIPDVFTMVGLQEFFYEQVSTNMKSIGIALCLSTTDIGGVSEQFPNIHCRQALERQQTQ